MQKSQLCCEKHTEPVYYTEKEYHPFTHTKTGRVRTAVSHLVCIICGKEVTVDGEYLAGSWRDE